MLGSGIGLGLTAALGAASLHGGLALRRHRAANNRMGAIGHSWVAQTFSSGALSLSGMLTHARQQSFGALDFNTATIRGHSGQTSTQLLDAANGYAQLDADIDALIDFDVGVVFLAVSRNDPAHSMARSATLANTQAIIARVQSRMLSELGHKPLILLMDGSPGSTHQSALLAIAQDARTLHDPVRGICVVGIYDVLADGPDSLTPKSGVLSDGLHVNPTGAYEAGAALYAAAEGAVPAVDLSNVPGLLFGGAFSGTGGSIVSGSVVPTGQVPSGWTLHVISSSTGSLVSSVVNQGGHTWWQISATALAAATIWLYDNTNRVGLVTPGTDRMDQTILFEKDAGSSGLGKLALQLRRQSGGAYGYNGNPSQQAIDSNWAGSGTPHTLPAAAMAGMLRLPHVLVDGAGTLMGPRIEFSTPAAMSGNFTLRFALPQGRKYGGLLTD